MDFGREPSFCGQDTQLLEEFAAATEAYYEAVRRLQRAEGYHETRQARELAALARKQCINAREAVERHREEHGCRKLRAPVADA